MAPESTPKTGCLCAVCNWANRRVARDTDLAVNYIQFLRGKLVFDDVPQATLVDRGKRD